MRVKHKRAGSSAFLGNFMRTSDTESIQTGRSLHGGDNETPRRKYQRVSSSKQQQQMARHRIGKKK